MRQDISIGAVTYSRKGLESLRQKGDQVDVFVIGLVHIASDVTPELARATIQSLKVYGVLRASREVKKALADRM